MLNGANHDAKNQAGSGACGQSARCQRFLNQKPEMSFPRYQKFAYRRYQKFSAWRLLAMGRSDMSTKDHNKTLVMLYAAIGGFYSFGIIAAPWIIERNFRRPEQIPTAIVIFGLVALIAVLFWLAAIYMHRRKRIGRTLALIATPITLFAFWPVGIYAWWFMHSGGGKSLYGITEDGS